VISPARVAAYDILLAVSGGRADLPTAIAHARSKLKDERDRALASEIATGVQRWRAALDHVIAQVSKRSLDRLDAEIVEILRLSAYQLLHLSRVPAAAVVDDAVNLAGRVGKRSASGLVNAVLRSISRARAALPLPPRPADPAAPEHRNATIDYLAITLSHPRWLVERWLDRFGFDATEQWLRFNNAPAPLTLRANRLRVTRDALAEQLAHHDVVVKATRFAPDGLTVEDGQLPGRVEGLLVMQDEASQLVALLAGRHPGPRLLDACAAPGGKTLAMAAAMAASAAGGGLLVACDVRGRRMDLLRRTVETSGAANVRLVQADLLQPLPFSRPFDCVLVDAPCSGLGILRRDPDIRWRRNEDDLPALAAAQLVMLRHAAAAVTPGGRLIYSTCSSEAEENEAVADAFLATSPGFAPIDLRHDPASALPPDVVDANGYLRTYPHQHGLEAFFGAAFLLRS
jgi:16S rRNA (cytosine967-C5)-methyltransferase